MAQGTTSGVGTSPLQHLRRYASYLAPRIGVLSTDTLTLVALYVRNLLLNWLVLIPMLVLGIAVVKLFAILAWITPATTDTIGVFGAFAIACIGVGLVDSLQQRPGWGDEASSRRRFFYLEIFPTLLGGSFASLSALKYFQLPKMYNEPLSPVVGTALIGGAIFLIAAVLALAFSPPRRVGRRSTTESIRTISAIGAVLVIAAFAAAGLLGGLTLALLAVLIDSFRAEHPTWVPFLLISLGPPMLFTALFVGELIYCGLTSYVRWGEAEREWLARAAGSHGRAAMTWLLVILVTFGGSYLFTKLYNERAWAAFFGVAASGGIAGIITSLIGKATLTAATLKQGYESLKSRSAALILAIAVPIFIVVTVGLLSTAIDWSAFGDRLWFQEDGGKPRPIPLCGLSWFLFGAFVLGSLASLAINTNRFSLHGIYRDRLIRTFLGASNADRSPNAFTDFDQHDNLHLASLWPNVPTAGKTPSQIFIINMALNIVASRELAWQERKALSFTATPRWIGCGDLAHQMRAIHGFYRLSSEYGGQMSFGTAMTISGAAASPNMGYHSSPALSLLLTFFNVRLGVWLGNPGPAGNRTHSRQGPLLAAFPMIEEAFGLTTDDKRYVYLSDGGHFENLGLYEMVRRRCRLIVVSDAGCDPTCSFEDLGNAMRKISIDLNIDINFRQLEIKPRATPPAAGPSCAVADIMYREPGAVPGLLLYIKPSFHGAEPASVRSYAIKNTGFPHEPTTKQWFGESQFEAYRALGCYTVDKIDGNSSRTYADIKTFIEAVAAHLVSAPKTKLKPSA